jgi:membrane-associated protein
MFDWVVNFVSGSAVTYVVIFAAVSLDAVVPLVPGEVTVITAAIVAADGGLSTILVGAVAAVAAFAGDNTGYWLGRVVGGRAVRKVIRGDKGHERLRWAERTIVERPWIITVGRFIPGGRTATTIAAGTVEMPWRRFAPPDAIGACAWAAYATALGYLGGSAFKDNLWKPMLVSAVIGALIALAGEGLRRLQVRREHGGPRSEPTLFEGRAEGWRKARDPATRARDGATAGEEMS